MGIDKSVRTMDNKIYAMPWTVLINDHPFLYADFDKYAISKDDIEFLGLAPGSVRTFEDMDELFQKAKQIAPPEVDIFTGTKLEIYGTFGIMAAVATNYVNMWSAFYSFTFNIGEYEKTGKITLEPMEQTACFYEAVKWSTKWVKDGIFPSDMFTNMDVYVNKPESTRFFTQQQIEGIYSRGGHYSPDEITNLWVSELYPDVGYMRKPPLANLLCINANAKNPERALMMVELVGADKEAYDMWIYGIENVTYIKDPETGFFSHPEGSSPTSSFYMNWPSRWGFWRAGMFAPSPEKPDQYWIDVEKYAQGPGEFINPLDSFVPNVESIKNEIALRTSLVNEVGVPLAYGMIPDGVDAIPAYIERQKKDGATDVIQAELQKQVDAYMESRK